MNLADIFPDDGEVQRIYCPVCGRHCDLAFIEFVEEVSGIKFEIIGLPTLRCFSCGAENLPDSSRMAIITLHEKAIAAGENRLTSRRRKIQKNFELTEVSFLYDADDYYYIPGLKRPWDEGFLTPVFFKRNALLKYDNAPGYRVNFASTTYGTIYTEDGYISFGINRHGNLVMWLGDIAKLPEEEQYYLRSENIPSDHSIGSEFYDGQIECVFTEKSREDELFKQRSDFIEACFSRFGEKVAQLDEEVMDLALGFNPPVVDTTKERRHVADTLNKIYLESLDNRALGKILTALGGSPKQLGSLKRLQGILELAFPNENISAKLSPLYILYDLRVACSHLHSTDSATEIFERVTDRLGLSAKAELKTIYEAMISRLTECFQSLRELISPARS